MLSRLIKAAIIAAVLAMVIDSLPDIKRYLELREMLSARTGEEVMGVEVVLGFVVGYLVGTRQGRDGLQKALDSAQAIMASEETRRMLGEGLAALESVAGPALDRVNGKSKGGKAAISAPCWTKSSSGGRRAARPNHPGAECMSTACARACLRRCASAPTVAR